MDIPRPHDVPGGRPDSADRSASTRPDRTPGQRLSWWGGIAGLTGVLLMLATAVVVGALGLPDASDVETLTDFSDIETGRILEHFFYLGAVVLFALHALVLHRLLAATHPPAALFGTAVAEIGLVTMAASSLLHVSTTPLADLYTDADATEADVQSIEYAWHGAQSVFDTMLATGVLLVPIGIVLLGIAMRHHPIFDGRLAWLAIGLGVLGAAGAAIEIVDGDTEFSALSVLAIVVFHAGTGWRTLQLARPPVVKSSEQPTTIG